MDDQTYYYKKDLGDIKDIVIIAVHFKNVFGSWLSFLISNFCYF